MPRILLIGNILDNSGYGKAVRLIYHDLSRFAEVKCYYVRRDNAQIKNAKQYDSCLTKTIDGYDGTIVKINIEGLIPHPDYTYFWAHEFDELPELSYRVSQCKNVLVYTENLANIVKKQCNVEANVYLPKLFDVPQFEKDVNRPYTFYKIANGTNPRKAVFEDIIAYFWEFTSKDNVLFKMKVNRGQGKIVEDTLKNVISKSTLRLKTDMPPLQFDENDYDDNEIMKVHCEGDCYMGTSYGEGLGLSVYEAASIGNPIICNNIPPYREWFHNYFPYGFVKSQKDISLHTGNGIGLDYNMKTMEWTTNIKDVADKMREMYESDVRKVAMPFKRKDNTEEIVEFICQ